MIVRLKYMYRALHGDNATKDRTDASIISAVTLHVNIILATVPCAKPFFVVFEGGAFRSPTDPMHTSGHSQSWNATGGSGQMRPPMNIRLPSQQQRPPTPMPSPSVGSAMVITWDRRQSFAPPTLPVPVQEPRPTAKPLTGRIGPWSFKSRQITWKKRRSVSQTISNPSSPPASHRSSGKSVRTRFSSPFSSLKSAVSRQARSELMPPREGQRDRSQESRLSSGSNSRLRRQSEVD